MLYSHILRPLLFQIEPELAHSLVANALCYCPQIFLPPVPAQPTTCMGLTFKNPVGLAAGMDKAGCYIDAFAKLGFGFIEVGGVTPSPQAGNPKPRLFRLPAVQGIINRMNFNNPGVVVAAANIAKRKTTIPIGVNICKDDATPIEDAANDYAFCFERLYPLVDYVSVNVSCPNTPGLEQLHAGEGLARLLSTLKEQQAQLQTQHQRYVPLVIKISPDLDEQTIEALAQAFLAFEVDGVIATNTSRARPPAVQAIAHGNERGGLSGAPVTPLSMQVLKQLVAALQGKIPLIASGGIMTEADAKARYAAGASLIQLYSGLVYAGPGLLQRAVR